jgi:hypothetical protein
VTVYAPAIPAGRGRWRLTLHNRQFSDQAWTATIVAQLDSARNRVLTQAWNQAATLTFDMDGGDPVCSLIQELQMDVIAWRWDDITGQDYPMFRGIIGASQDQIDESSHVVSFTCTDYLAMFERRIWTGAAPLSFPASTIDNYAVQILAYSSQYACETGSGVLFRNAAYLPLAIGSVNPDGTARATPVGSLNYTVQGNSVWMQMLDDASKLSPGFDYDVLPLGAGANTNPSLAPGVRDSLRIWYPQQGQIRSEPVLMAGANLAKIDRQLVSSTYANYVRAVGNNQNVTQNANQLYGEAWTSDAMNLGVGTFMTPIQGTSDQTDQALITAAAQGELNIDAVLIPTYKLTLAPDFWSYGLFNLGDTVPLVIARGRLNVNTTIRILGFTFTIGDDGQEDIDLVVGRPRTDLLTMMNKQAASVRALSRR